MSAWLEQTAGRGTDDRQSSPDGPPAATSTPAPRHPWATFSLAATVAVVSGLVLLTSALIIVALRVLGVYYGLVEVPLVLVLLAAVAGLIVAAAIAVDAAVRRPPSAQRAAPTNVSGPGAAAFADPGRPQSAFPPSGPPRSGRSRWSAVPLAVALVLVPCVLLALAYSALRTFDAMALDGLAPSPPDWLLSIVFVLLWSLLAAGVVVAVVILVRGVPHSAAGRPGASAWDGRSSHRTRLLLIAAGLAGGSVLLLVVFWTAGISYGTTGSLVLVGATLVSGSGLVAAAVLGVRAVWPGRPTSLRTRAFFVIALAVLVPSLCLAWLGAWAYYRSWETATSLYSEQAGYQAREVADEIASVQRQRDRFSAEERARLVAAIAAAYGAQGHIEGAQLATLEQLRSTSTLPRWALRGLARDGYAIGTERGPGPSTKSDIVAWRVDGTTVRYYVPVWTATPFFSAPTPVDRLLSIAVFGAVLILAVGLLGAWLISRNVVRPVRRLAEASGRLAEGEAGVTVTPQGPRELQELALSFNDMNARLTKAQETEQAFLLSVSHELKTPLTSVRGYAEGIGDGTVEAAAGASVIGAEASRLERLVGDLLESGRMRKSAFTVRREPVDLAAVAGDVARRYEVPARDAGLTLLLDTEAGGEATADHDRVLQVVSNLVENAIRCTPAPGTVTITTAGGAITVADTGRGLTSDDLPRAFERFYLYSRYGTDRPVGTGLGLAIVKELTEAMDGSVDVSSAVGVGTAFTVSLPPAAVPEDGGATISPARPAKDDVS